MSLMTTMRSSFTRKTLFEQINHVGVTGKALGFGFNYARTIRQDGRIGRTDGCALRARSMDGPSHKRESGFRVKEQRPSFLKLGLVKKIEILPLSLYSSLIPHSFRNAEKRIYHQ